MIELFIEEDHYRRIAIKNNGILSECYFEDKNQEVRSGDLFFRHYSKKSEITSLYIHRYRLEKECFSLCNEQ
jgi:hypothetical protein